MSKKIKGIIFDLDGILTDTAEYHYRSWKKPLEDIGIYFSKSDNEKLRGLSRRDSIRTIISEKKAKISKEKEEEIMDDKNKYYQYLISDLNRDDMLPGIYDILCNLKEKKYRLAVASSSRNAKIVIDSLGLNSFFETVSDGNSVERSKPAPDLFLLTAEMIDIKPENCLVLEDSKAGVKGAKRAGMWVIGIGPKDRIGDADFCYKNVVDIELDKILT